MVGNAFVLVGKQLPADHTGNSPELFLSKKIGVVLFIENHRGLYLIYSFLFRIFFAHFNTGVTKLVIVLHDCVSFPDRQDLRP